MADPRVVIDIIEFQMMLKKIDNFSNPILITSMEIAQNVVRDHAISNHKRAPKEGHPDDRYYDRSARLTNSIRALKVKADRDKIIGDVSAGTPGLVDYARDVELGTVRSRAYPFMGPALSETESKVFYILNAGVNKVIRG